MSQSTRRATYLRSNSALSTGRTSANFSDKVYYRLRACCLPVCISRPKANSHSPSLPTTAVTYNAPYNSAYPIDPEDDSLSFLHASRIPPPGLAADYVHRICAREGIHATRAKLYTSTPACSVYANVKALPDDPAFVLVAPDVSLRLYAGGCGRARADPLVLFLDLDPSMDRTQAALPMGRLERGGRRVAKVVRKGYGAVAMAFLVCFGSLQKVPKGMQ
ncbi:hypothetical protein EW145_g7368 [Phellinidium pouzarii]|uniref:Uncharacterized protein n=1 Tax=Phellinidium pouzarii TaxID=167371 RepID=A0A4V3XAN3_9AGAM|nr:hypothetical protein EW145_g7368 [Phellinidium pouzarii]